MRFATVDPQLAFVSSSLAHIYPLFLTSNRTSFRSRCLNKVNASSDSSDVSIGYIPHEIKFSTVSS